MRPIAAGTRFGIRGRRVGRYYLYLANCPYHCIGAEDFYVLRRDEDIVLCNIAPERTRYCCGSYCRCMWQTVIATQFLTSCSLVYCYLDCIKIGNIIDMYLIRFVNDFKSRPLKQFLNVCMLHKWLSIKKLKYCFYWIKSNRHKGRNVLFILF